MNCCCTSSKVRSTDKFFTKSSRRYIKRYLKKGLEPEQLLLLEGIMKTDPRGKTILDIGCGVGQMHFELLKNDAASASGFDIAEGQLAAARDLAERFGFAERVTYTQGDFLTVGVASKNAGITILDKVVCCYPDADALVDASLAKTDSVYALSFPRTIWITRYGIAILTFAARIFRGGFHPYWHDWAAIVTRIERAGFRRVHHGATMLWDAYVFVRR